MYTDPRTAELKINDLDKKCALLKIQLDTELKYASDMALRIREVEGKVIILVADNENKSKRVRFFTRNWRFFTVLAGISLGAIIGLYEVGKYLLYLVPPK